MPVPRWFVSRLIHDVKTCRVTEANLEAAALAYKTKVDSMLQAIDSLKAAYRRENELRDQAARLQSDRILNQLADNLDLRREVRRQKRQKIAVIGIGLVLVVLAAL